MVGSDFYFIEDIVALYLYITKQRAEQLLGQSIDHIVLGRPVRFSVDPELNQLAQQRLLYAAFRAGYQQVYLQYEPIAAAYYYETTIQREQNVLVFDFGGGTLDISIVRLGNPRTRKILATSGIPIAGDIFDQKLVRAKLPRHFGEGTSYQADDGTIRPIPSHYFEAFAAWQTLLELNTPRNMEILEQIARTSTAPRQLKALLQLISSNYGLKIYDEAEAAKRELSGSKNALMQLNGPGFNVTQLVTRQEFEHLIARECEAIEDLLDDVLSQAGLRPHQIDAVIRTGGSSQIPVFIEMLQEHFGSDKVQSIDTFSSVTSGLGVIGHCIAQGEIEATPFYPEDATHASQVSSSMQVVDFEIVKKFVDLQEAELERDTPTCGLVALSQDYEVKASLQSAPADSSVEFAISDVDWTDCLPMSFIVSPPDEKILLMTSEYRFFTRSLRELARLNMIKLRLEEAESLHVDAFGDEFISAICRVEPYFSARQMLLISTSGYARLLRMDGLIPHLQQPSHFRLDTMPGYPAALIEVDESRTIVIVSSAGNMIRIPLPTTTRRVMKVAEGERVIGAFSATPNTEILIMDRKGRAKRLYAYTIPVVSQLATGRKMVEGEPGALVVRQPDADLWAVTSHRMLPLDADHIPLCNGTSRPWTRLLHLSKGEELIGLQTM